MNVIEREVEVPLADGAGVAGNLAVPEAPLGAVIFAHGSGSSRFSPRNRFVANVLQRSRLATLLLDLLTPEEEEAERVTRHLRFDIDLLSGRLVQAARWLHQRPDMQALRLGYFGASTGAAAALVAAAREPDRIGAVVSRGGRPDLAGNALPLVRAPTLLIVGGDDVDVLELNRRALEALRTEKWLEVVPGASHLFEEPGALELVADLATRFLVERLGFSTPWQLEDGWA
jgi:putative phosphoribosyl transferase